MFCSAGQLSIREYLAVFPVSTLVWRMSHSKEKELTVKRNAVLVTAVLFCFAVFATASEHKKESAPQSQNAPQQNEMYGQYAEVRMDDNAAAKAEYAPQAEPKSTL